MSAASYVGRVGALAAAFGVGAAILGGPTIAWADPTASDTSGASAPDSRRGAQAEGDKASTPARRHTARGPRAPRPSSSATAQSPSVTGQPSSDTGTPDAAEISDTGTPDAPDVDAPDVDAPEVDAAEVDVPDVDVPEVVQRDITARRGGDSAVAATPEPQAGLTPGPAAATSAKADIDTGVANGAGAVTSSAAEFDALASTESSAAEEVAVPAAAAAQTVTSLVEAVSTPVTPAQSVTSTAVVPTLVFPTALAKAADQISTVINSVVTKLVNTFSGYSPFGPQVDSPVNWLVLAAARRQPLAAASAAATGAELSPTLVLDGYYVVPTSTKIIDAFTGRWAFWPGQPNMLQGRQDFNLVDPNTGESVGAFSALVTSGDPTSIGAHYVQMLVTANDGRNVGAEAGQTPPVGSLISEFTLGLVGATYSAMPTPSGDKVSVKLKTPFGAIALPLTFDAAAGIADRTFDNRPMDITGGFSIAPADPDAEKITATIGMLPLFNSVQGRQVFGIFDSDGKQVGSFDGEFTTTSDTLGIYTQAILVTGNDGTNVGTEPGQTPPVGTVYNVAYFFSDDNWLLYSSMPTDSGKAVITLKFGTPNGVADLQKPLIKLLIPQANFNASREPAMKPLITPGGQKFVPTSEVIPSGVNGLPPRDVQIQGYQQFDVYDFLGRKIGTVDADVQSQWDASTNTRSKAILITNVTSGDVGSTPLNVPPVGTVMNFIDFGNGFGITDTVIPGNGVDVNAFQFTTLFGNIPLLPTIIPVTHPEVEYYNPFV